MVNFCANGRRRADFWTAEVGICCRSTVTAQANFEKSVFAKTRGTNARGEGAFPSDIIRLAVHVLFKLRNTDTNLVFCAGAAEITMFDSVTVVYKTLGDLMFYVTGSQDENELILYTVLQGFYESISLLLRCAGLPIQSLCRVVQYTSPLIHMDTSRGAVEKKTVLENLDLVLLAIDEIVDGGCAWFSQQISIMGTVSACV